MRSPARIDSAMTQPAKRTPICTWGFFFSYNPLVDIHLSHTPLAASCTGWTLSKGGRAWSRLRKGHDPIGQIGSNETTFLRIFKNVLYGAYRRVTINSENCRN